jgi:hypothetical protein
MQERRFNFVRRTNRIKFDFVARETRVAAGHAAPRGRVTAARGLLLSAAVFAVFIFSANLLVRTAFEKLDIKGFALNISPLAKPMYFISDRNMYVVYSSGKTELVDRNMDKVSLPFISGVAVDEKNRERKKALKMALALNPAFLDNVSEISLSNPENIIIITLDGRKVFAGDGITDEKMENYHIALDRITRSYSTVDLRYRDRVIFK